MIFEKHSYGRLSAGLLVAALTLGVADVAKATCPPGLPPGVTCGGADLSLATAGTYAVDPNHASVIAKVSHIGYS